MLVLKFFILAFCSSFLPTLTYSEPPSIDICSIWSESWKNSPELRDRIYTDVKVFGGANAGKYSRVKVNNWYECVVQCCQFTRCNVAFWISSTCLHVECSSDELCQPTTVENSNSDHNTLYAKVRSVRTTAAAIDYEDPGQDECNQTRACLTTERCEQVSISAQLKRYLCLCDRDNGFRRINGVCRQYLPRSKPCVLYEKDYEITDDESGTGICRKNEECLPPNDRAKHGYCQCKLGYLRSSDIGKCIEDKEYSLSSGTILSSTRVNSVSSTVDLEVEAGEDQTIVLPTNQVDLFGRVFFKSNRSDINKLTLMNQSWNLVWSLKSSSNGVEVAIISDKDSPFHITVKQLQNGVYHFELKMIDKQGAVLSTDEVKVEVISAQTTAPSLLLKITSPVRVRLPQQVTLLQAAVEPSASRATYQWTYLKDGPTAPILENADTSDLSVSNLRPGNYSFQIHVVDNLGYELTKTVRLIAIGEPIEARVSNVREIVFWPSNEIVLDGTSSVVEPGTNILWSMLSTDNQQQLDEVEIHSPNSLKTRISHLRIGQYRFQLQLTTVDHRFTSKIEVLVIVYTQNGRPPKIHIQLETPNVDIFNNLIILNATGTIADYGIARWQWMKSPSSPALGHFLHNSDTSPIAYLTNTIEGQYVFILQVIDDRQQMSEMNISVKVDGMPEAENLIEIGFSSKPFLYQQTLNNLLAQIRVFLIDLYPNIFIDLVGITKDNLLLIKSKDSKLDRVILPKLIADHLRTKIKALRAASNVNILSVDTFLCLSNCSNHGKCDRSTKRCVCDRYYMENWFKSLFHHEPNCDFLIHYFVLSTVLGSILSIAFCCSCLCCCLRWRRRRYLSQRRKRIRYQLLHETDDYDDYDDQLSNLSPEQGKGKVTRSKKGVSLPLSDLDKKGKTSTMVVSESENELSDTNGEQTLYDRPLLAAKFRTNTSTSKGRGLKVPVQDSNGSPMLRNNGQSPTTTDNSVA